MTPRSLLVVSAAAVATLSVVAVAAVEPGFASFGREAPGAQSQSQIQPRDQSRPLSGAASATGSRSASPKAASIGAASSTAALEGAGEGPPRRASTAPVLPRQMQGASAVGALGSQLGAVARRNGLSAEGLRQLLRSDRTAWVSQAGQVFFDEPPSEAATVAVSPSSSSATAMPAYPTDQTFALHSNPTATRVLFLDMDGATVSGTAWNSATPPMTAGDYPGWDTDGHPTTFGSAEHAWIQEVWREVSETYAPFDVDVTTQDPGPGGYTYSSTADTAYGTHVVVTSSTTAATQACGSACSGKAFLNTFKLLDNGPLQPAWVFTRLSDGSSMPAAVAAQTAAHEAGHTLGLRHDGVLAMGTKPASAYYAGTTAWGPIMGSATWRAVSQWSKGEYAGASNTEDDLAVIQTNGLPLRADDAGDDTASATSLGAAPTYAADGVISTRTDTDVFALDRTCSAAWTASVKGIGVQTALDLSLTVLDSSGQVVTSDSPTSGWIQPADFPLSTGMDAGVTVPAGTGRYYLKVDGVGSGNPAATGWSDYASLGQYHLTAAGCPAVAPSASPSASPTTSPSSSPSTSPTTAPTTGPTTSPSTTPTSTPAQPTPTVTVSVSPTPSTAPATKPGPPRIGTAYSGTNGGAVTAQARWAAPTSTGGTPITKYRVAAKKLDSRNRTIATYYASSYSSASTRVLNLRLPRGRYVFVVRAWNAVGYSGYSASSRIVTAR